jgi:hypothetical protein
MMEPWLNPPTTIPLLQSAFAREQSLVIALAALLGLKTQRALPEICVQLPNWPFAYWTVAAT